jgi:hypothetical protein
MTGTLMTTSDKKSFQLVGDTFTHLTGGNKGYSVHGKESKYISWTPEYQDEVFYLDYNIDEALDSTTNQRRYGWLLESKYIVPGVVEKIKNNLQGYLEAYEMIFTHNQELLALGDKFKWVPAQGFWIKEPGIYDKTKLVSMISSNKNMALGHSVRLAWVEELRTKVDLYGRGFQEIESKEQGLCDYMFSVAIENGQYETYFTEKILDCFATGTIPVYLGAPDIGKHFNSDGIVDISQFDDISPELYYNKRDAIQDNLERVKDMEVLEDFIYKNYLEKM